ncbi:MAG: tetratricopeptide repeat protein, partial [Microcystis sp.]
YQEALALRKELLGERHPDVADSLSDLANLYNLQGRYELAEPLHQEALALRKELLGERHPDVASSLNNLASLYESQGRYELAEPLYEEALALYKNLLGERHPHVASSLNNLAILYESQRRYELVEALRLVKGYELYELAESLYVEALEIAEEKLGTDHPRTVKYRKNLANLRSQLPRGIGQLVVIILGIILLPFYLLWLGLRWLMRRLRR